MAQVSWPDRTSVCGSVTGHVCEGGVTGHLCVCGVRQGMCARVCDGTLYCIQVFI